MEVTGGYDEISHEKLLNKSMRRRNTKTAKYEKKEYTD